LLSLDPRDGTGLWDAVVLAAGQLRAHGLPGRAIILVSDGQETTSKATLAQAIAAVRAARASVYAVGIPDRTFTPAPMRRLAQATGGRYYRAPSSSVLDSIYRTIAAELARTWQLQFLTAARPGDTLKLTVNAGGTRVTARKVLPIGLGVATNPSSPLPLLLICLLVVAALAAVTFLPVMRSWIRFGRWFHRSPDF
jgi:hypothetical protein